MCLVAIARGLNVYDNIATIWDQLVRSELCQRYAAKAAPWNSEKDCTFDFDLKSRLRCDVSKYDTRYRTNIDLLLDSELNESVCTTSTTCSNSLKSPVTISTSMSKEFRSRMSPVICSAHSEIAPVVHLPETKESSARPPAYYSAGEGAAVSPVISRNSLVDIPGFGNSPPNSIDKEAKVSNSFVSPVEYNGETFRSEEISNQATQLVPVPCETIEVVKDSLLPVEVESCRTDIKFSANRNASVPCLKGDDTASNSFSNDSLYRARPRKQSILPVDSEPDSPSNPRYYRDSSSDVSMADTDIRKRRKRRKRRHKRPTIRFSRRESEHQPNCDNSWRINKPIREPRKPSMSHLYPSKSSLPQYSKVSSFNKYNEARNVMLRP